MVKDFQYFAKADYIHFNSQYFHETCKLKVLMMSKANTADKNFC